MFTVYMEKGNVFNVALPAERTNAAWKKLAGWMTSAPVAAQAGSPALQDKPRLEGAGAVQSKLFWENAC
jgi:hypothetical protein